MFVDAKLFAVLFVESWRVGTAGRFGLVSPNGDTNGKADFTPLLPGRRGGCRSGCSVESLRMVQYSTIVVVVLGHRNVVRPFKLCWKCVGLDLV